MGDGFFGKGSYSGRSGKGGSPRHSATGKRRDPLCQDQLFCDICTMRTCLLLWILLGGLTTGTPRLSAQDKPSESVKRTLVPVFRSSLGNVLSNTIPASLMRQLLDSALIARDSMGEKHPVVSFEFGYRTTASYHNDTTGRIEQANSYLSFHFASNRLDSLWRNRIAQQIKPGDELYFERIIAEGPQGVKFLSSPLHFQVNGSKQR